MFNNGKSFVLGSNGKLIESIEKKAIYRIYLGSMIKIFFNLLKSIKNSNFRISNIKNLYFFKSGRWDIETKLDVIIKLPKDNLKDSLNLSLDILNDNEFKKVKILDLRQHNQIIINEG